MGKILLAAAIVAMLSGCQSTAVSADVKSPASPQKVPVVAPAGSVLRVRLNETLETGRSRPGDRFSGVFDSALVSGLAEILPKGTKVEGHVTVAQTPGSRGGRAVLAITLDGFESGGEQFPILANVVKRTAPEPVRHVEIDADSIVGFTLTGSLKN